MPIWLLGSSGYSAQLAARLGLPFAFAAQFAPGYLFEALRLYRDQFQPSEHLAEPYAMVGLPVMAADSDDLAHYLATTAQQKFLNLIRGRPTQSQPRSIIWTGAPWSAPRSPSFLARPSSVALKRSRSSWPTSSARTEANELMINSDFYQHADRLRSYEIVASVVKDA